MGTILALLLQVIASVPSLIKAGEDITDLLTSTRAVIDEHKVPGDPDWDKVDAFVKDAQVGALRDTSRDLPAQP